MTNEERAYLDAITQLGCAICGAPAEVHHIMAGRHSQRRVSHLHSIPLCPYHHRLGPRGEAIHAGRQSWKWDEWALWRQVQDRIKELEANAI